MSDNADPRMVARVSHPPTPPERFAGVQKTASRGSTFARGLLLLGGLVTFTLFYALLLHWMSQPANDAPPEASVPVAARQSGATAQRAGAVTQVKAPPAGAFTRLDDANVLAGNGFIYSGTWQHIRNVNDGRSSGTSTRTFHIGSSANFHFTGRFLKIYGVKGPNGGYAELRIDGETYALLRFYAPHKESGALIYSNAELPSGSHAVKIVVAEAPDGLPKRRFVNLDGVSFAP